MITLIVVKNPFEPWNGREQKNVVAGSTAKELLQTYSLPNVETLISVNGEEVAESYVTKSGDFVVICPVVGKGGKQILGIVAAIALSFAAGAVGGALAKTLATGAKVWTTASYLAAAAVMFLGNTLIGRLTAQKVDLGNYGGESNPTYSWGEIQTMQGQNNAIALTYGTVMSGGQSIGKYVTTQDNQETLNWLIAAGEGPLEISDITLNDNAIENFEDVEVEIRNGTNTQSVISNFNDTYFTKPLEYQLTDNARTDEAQGNATEALIAKIEFPNGLYYANDSGGLSEAWVELFGEYRRGQDGEWIPFIYEMRDVTEERTVLVDDGEGSYYDTETVVVGQEMVGKRITGGQSSALRREYRIDNLAPDKYYMRMKVTARSHELTNSRAAVRCYWTGITSVVYDDFCYPNTALIGIKALATDQLNGSPSLKFKKQNPYVWVWNPYINEYEQKASDNPAWASYDALHLCRELENPNNLGTFEFHVGGVAKERMMYDRFSEWADFCDNENLKVNIEINQLGEMLDIINQKIAPIGHGKVVRFGTRYGCTWDCAKQPVQMFGMGNIIAGSFNEQFLPTNDRANAVELTYMDADNGFNRETITVLADDYDTTVDVKTAQATFDGITSYEQAYREGKYQLLCNKYRIRTVSFEADIDAISCMIGDVVLVAHDVPKWAKSGRIHEINGNEILLPVELEDATKSYRFAYRTVNDNLHTTSCEILENKDGWCKIRIPSFNEADPPQQYDIFDLAETNVGSKPFIIQNITRSKKYRRKIECIEYDERVYNDDYDIPPVQYSEEDARPKNVTNLSATSYNIISVEGNAKQHLDISWEQASVGTFSVFVYDNNTWHLLISELRTNRYSTDYDGTAEQVRVVTVSGAISTTGTIAEIVNIDTIRELLKINNLSVTVTIAENVGTVQATWDAVTATNLDSYTVEFRGSSYKINTNKAEFGGVPVGTYTLSVQAVTKQRTSGATSSIPVIVESEEITDDNS